MGIRDYEFRGRTYDQWELGEEFITGARTITEADIVNFAGLSGDWSATHTNDVYGKSTIYGSRIAYVTFHVFVYNQNDEQVAEERLVFLISSEKGHM